MESEQLRYKRSRTTWLQLEQPEVSDQSSQLSSERCVDNLHMGIATENEKPGSGSKLAKPLCAD